MTGPTNPGVGSGSLGPPVTDRALGSGTTGISVNDGSEASVARDPRSWWRPVPARPPTPEPARSSSSPIDEAADRRRPPLRSVRGTAAAHPRQPYRPAETRLSRAGRSATGVREGG